MKQPQVRYKRLRSAGAGNAPGKEESSEEERMLDDALDQTFPASDPVAPAMPHDTSPGSKDAPPKKRRFPARKSSPGKR